MRNRKPFQQVLAGMGPPMRLDLTLIYRYTSLSRRKARAVIEKGPSRSPAAYITDTITIRRILDHLGLSPPEKPPPDFREIVRVPVDDEGRQIGANPA
jgi:hypothetical protein